MPKKIKQPLSQIKKIQTDINVDHRALNALHQVTLDLINRHDVEEILNSLLVQSADLLDAPCVSIDLLESDDVIITRAATPGQPLEVGDKMRRSEGGLLSWQAVDSRKPAVLDDYAKWAGRRSLYDNFPIHAILIIPIIQREMVIGTINFLRFKEGKVFTASDIYFAGQLAEAAALVLDNARVYAELKSELEERKQAETALREAQSQMVEKEQALAALNEREHLARDLHDGIGQMLGYISMQSDLALGQLQKNDTISAQQTLSKLADAAEQANRDVREYILGLKDDAFPAAQQDFFSALEQYCQHAQMEYHFNINMILPKIQPDVLASAEVETQLTYIVREALHNARKHSGASQASLTIDVDDEFVQAIVEDPGKGMGGTYSGPERRKGAHFGMGIMRSRAEEVGGSLYIDTSPVTGTRIIVRLPRRLAGVTFTQLRILLADDHPLFIDGVRNMLMLRGAQVVGIAKDGIEAVELARLLKPDLLIMDLNMPRMNGIEATRSIKAEMADLKIIILTTSMDEENLFAALSAGASGYLLKGMGVDEFMTMLGEVALGEAIFSSDMAAKMLEIFARPELQASPTQARDHLEALSERQRDVLSLVAQGLTYKEVGTHLFLTERTIKFHMAEILKRLQLKGRRELLEFTKRNKAG